MRRALALIAVSALAALAACNKPGSKEAAQSSAPASSAPAAAESASSAEAAAPAHNWVSRSGQEYQYISAAHGQEGADTMPTTVRYLGEKDGRYYIAEVESGAVVVASCVKPCTEVHLQGQGLDETLPLSPTSIVAAALNDAMNGQLEVFKVPGAPAG